MAHLETERKEQLLALVQQYIEEHVWAMDQIFLLKEENERLRAELRKPRP